jgi:hypothetical protein
MRFGSVYMPRTLRATVSGSSERKMAFPADFDIFRLPSVPTSDGTSLTIGDGSGKTSP